MGNVLWQQVPENDTIVWTKAKKGGDAQLLEDQGFSDLIYEYFKLRFHFECYKQGDQLPTIETLCNRFNISSLTVRTALKRLEAEGMLSMHNGRRSTVIFDQSREERDDFAIRFFNQRRHALPDLFQSAELVVLPMLAKGFSYMDACDLATLDSLARQTAPEQWMRFYCYVLQKTGNTLLMNLFWEIVVFFGIPFPLEYQGRTLYDVPLGQKQLLALLESGKKGDKTAICRTHHAFQKSVSEQIIDSILCRFPPAPQQEQVSFAWCVYRERPQLCSRVAIEVMHDVYQGAFYTMPYLPSYEKMAAKYEVSLSTMRRTIGLLNQLGATRSINGKGTRVLMLHDKDEDRAPDLTIPSIRRNLAYFIQSFELMAESCEDVMRRILSALSKQETDELTDMLQEYLRTGQYVICLLGVFAFLAAHSPLQGLGEIYGKLYGFNLWGYPLKDERQKRPGLYHALFELTQALVQALQENDFDRFAETMGAFVKREYAITMDILLEQGFSREELRMPSVFNGLD